MKRTLGRIFGKQVKTAHTAGGRAFVSSHYVASGPNGREWKVERHEWCIPYRRLAWKATNGDVTVYGDNLEEVAHAIGYPWEYIDGL